MKKSKLSRVLEKPVKAQESEGLVPISITVEVEALAELQRIGRKRKLARQRGATVSAMVREALREWLVKRGSFDEAADSFVEGMKRDKKRPPQSR